MKKLLLTLLMLLFACPALAEEAPLAPGDYVIGADAEPGMYSWTGSGEDVIVRDWDGSILYQQPGDSVMRLYNEQTLHLPEKYQAALSMRMYESAYDTGARQLRMEQPGLYMTGETLPAGLYIVEAVDEPDGPVRLFDRSSSAEVWQFGLHKGLWYTVYLDSTLVLELPQGCILRSMAAIPHFQTGTSETIRQARLLSYFQMPRRKYIITGLDEDSCMMITVLGRGRGQTRRLPAGESYVLDMNGYDGAELLVELVNVTVSWEAGNG